MSALKLQIIRTELTVHRLEAAAAIPAELLSAEFCSITRTPEELSIVCSSSHSIPGGTSESGWCTLKVIGPLDFSLTGILSRLSSCLAAAGISIFAISTFDTDYILIRKSSVNQAISALANAGYELVD